MRKIVLSAGAAAAGLALVGAALGATTLKLSADPKNRLAYDKKTLVAKAGKVTIVMANPSILPHNVAVKKGKISLAKGKVVLKGGVSTVSVTLAKGTYTFYCTVPGHEAAGMKGTLVVK